MDFTLVKESNSEIRRKSRQYLKGLWFVSVLGMMILRLFVELVPNVTSIIIEGGSFDLFSLGYGGLHQVSIVNSLYGVIFSGVFLLGWTYMILSIVRFQKAQISLLFKGFDYFWASLKLFLVKTILISLWTFLLIIPGIIATYKYSMAFYILADDPKKSVTRCLRESTVMMRGNKVKLFTLQLSFIGWNILAAIPLNIFIYWKFSNSEKLKTLLMENTMPSEVSNGKFLEALAGSNSLVFYISIFLVTLPILVVTTYYFISESVFYEIASGRMQKEEEILRSEDIENVSDLKIDEDIDYVEVVEEKEVRKETFKSENVDEFENKEDIEKVEDVEIVKDFEEKK